MKRVRLLNRLRRRKTVSKEQGSEAESWERKMKTTYLMTKADQLTKKARKTTSLQSLTRPGYEGNTAPQLQTDKNVGSREAVMTQKCRIQLNNKKKRRKKNERRTVRA